MKRTVWNASFLLYLACASGGAAPRTAQSSATADDKSALVARALAPAAEALGAEGYVAPFAPEVGFLAPAMRAVSRIRIEPHRCVAFAAVATPSITDLDAALYAADGSVLAEDDSAGARPLLRLCSDVAAITGYLTLHAFQGTGSYAVARFERQAGARDQALHAEGPRGSSRFRELMRTLYGRGYSDDTPPVELPLVPGVATHLAAPVRAGQCYSAVVDGTALRLRLLDADGRELALGVGVEGPAALQYCAAQALDLTLEVATSKAGVSALLARLSAPQIEVGGARSVWLGEPAPAAVEALPSPEQEAPPKNCEGAPHSLARHQPLAQGAVWEQEIEDRVRCTLIQVELHEGLLRLTVRAESAEGTVLAQREIVEKPGSIYICDPHSEAKLSLIARAGFGSVSVTSKSCGH